MSLPPPLLAALDQWFDEGNRAALDEACELAVRGIAIDQLLDWVEKAKTPPERRRLAASALRYRLGLPVVPGAPCRKGP